MEKQFLFNEVFQIQNQPDAEVNTKLMGDEFSDLVDVMRQNKHVPIPSINKLMTLFWKLVGNKICPVASTNVPTISFWCEIQRKNNIPKSIAVILLPPNWHDLLIADPFLQMGAIVFVASQAKDYWNGKFGPLTKKEILIRAASNEAELLHFFKRTAPKFIANEYQQQILEKFPLGISSEKTNYDGREYDGIFPPFPINF